MSLNIWLCILYTSMLIKCLRFKRSNTIMLMFGNTTVIYIDNTTITSVCIVCFRWCPRPVFNKMSSCVLCDIPIDFHRPQEYAKLSERGCIGINNASKERQLETPELVYSESSPIYVHVECRSKHNNPKAIKSALKHTLSADVKQKKLRSHIFLNIKHTVCCAVYL